MQSLTIREIKNNPATMTAPLEKGDSVFITKHGKPIGIGLPLDGGILDHGVKELLYFDLYKQGEISFGKLAQFLGVRKDKLRRMFAAMEMPVIDYPAEDVWEELKVLDTL